MRPVDRTNSLNSVKCSRAENHSSGKNMLDLSIERTRNFIGLITGANWAHGLAPGLKIGQSIAIVSTTGLMNFILIAKGLARQKKCGKPDVWPHALLDNQAEVRKAGNQESGEGLIEFYEQIVKDPRAMASDPFRRIHRRPSGQRRSRSCARW